MAHQYEITETDGTPFISAQTIAACATACRVTPRKMATHDVAALNREAGCTAYVARRVESV